MSEKLPLEHIVRPQVPWRDVELTECGHEIAELRHVITRAAFVLKLREQGRQRAALTTCMTCFETVQRWGSAEWNQNPAAVLARELERSRYGKTADRVQRELLGLAALVAAHREEFDSYVAGLEQTINLSDARREKRRSRA